MEDKEKDNQQIEHSDVFQVTPIESPSKNYLVIDNLQRMPNIFSRGLLYLIVLALFSALIYSLLGEIDIVTECRAVAKPISYQTGVISDRNGYITKVSVSEGQVVEKDAPLFHIRSKEIPSYLSKVENLRYAISLKKKYYDTLISSRLEELNKLYANHSNSLRVNKLGEKKFIEEKIEREREDYKSKKVMLESEMKNLKIEVQKPGQKEPERTVTIPITSLHIGLKLMPKKIKSSLEAEGVDLTVCSDLTKEKDLRGTLIVIECLGEKVVISAAKNS